MSIQSLGIGSGIDLESLVTQLLSAERVPKENRLNTREREAEAEISGFGQLKSKMSELEDSLEDLKDASDLSSRKVSINGEDASDEDEDSTAFITGSASSSALAGAYDISIDQLARGSRIETANASAGGFTAASDSVLTSGSGDLAFSVPGTGDSFTINVSAGMTLEELRNAINDDADNFGVTANIIDTGTADGGAKLVFNSSVTGSGNDLQIRNVGDIAELNRVATTDAAGTASYLSPTQQAQNAKATIDGIAVESDSNTFEGAILGVTLNATSVSELNADGVTRETTTVNIGVDKDNFNAKIDDFIEQYNALVDEIDNLTSYGATPDDADGALAGDSLARSLRQGLSDIVGGTVAGNELGGLFSIGIELNNQGRLEKGTTDFGRGTGQERLDDVIENNFDQIATLFNNDAENGLIDRFSSFLELYTDNGGLIESRTEAAKAEQDLVADDRERLETRMASYEDLLRDRYLNLDQTVARLNQTGSALLASLGQS